MTREEQYLAKIAGEETGIPNKPLLRSEQYLAKIAGEDVEIPEKPLLNEEIYLAILAGEEYEIPEPVLRIEQYMAKACGLEIEAPTPITRVEQLWAKIAEGGSWTVTEITGTLPLTFLSKGDDLTDYRIHGTSAGAGVETENLFDISVGYSYSGRTIGLTSCKLFVNADEVIYLTKSSLLYTRLAYYNNSDTRITASSWVTEGYAAITIPTLENYSYSIVEFKNVNGTNITQTEAKTISEVVVSRFTPPSSYIPYGYKLPLMVESGEQSQDIPVYIGNSKLGEEEYVDYGEQKIYRRILFMTHDNKHFITKDNKDFCLRRESYNG